MIKIKEHQEKMKEVKKQIETARGLHKKDLIRQYARLERELKTAQFYLREVRANA